MTKMLIANAVARMEGCVTLAKAVLVGPVLKNRQNTAQKSTTQAAGNAVCNTASSSGKPMSIAAPDTRKYEPLNLLRNRSPAIPPANVANKPDVAEIAPKMKFTWANRSSVLKSRRNPCDW